MGVEKQELLGALSLRRVLLPRLAGRLRGLSWQQQGAWQGVNVVVLGLVATEGFGVWWGV